MEREVWKRIVLATRAVSRRRTQKYTYSDKQILDVVFWAALHDRPVSWACKRCNWPMQAWRRRLPNQSTMSRRLREPIIKELFERVLRRVQARWVKGRLLIVDSKSFVLSRNHRDPDAINGYAGPKYGNGYKLHLIIDDQHQVLGWQVHAMNVAETTTAASILREAKHIPARFLVGDRGYDSNPLYFAAESRGIHMMAPRKVRDVGFSTGHRQHRYRRQAARWSEQRGGWMWRYLHVARIGIERYFSNFVASAAGSTTLPTWARRLHRVRMWLGAKVVVHAARIATTVELDA